MDSCEQERKRRRKNDSDPHVWKCVYCSKKLYYSLPCIQLFHQMYTLESLRANICNTLDKYYEGDARVRMDIEFSDDNIYNTKLLEFHRKVYEENYERELNKLRLTMRETLGNGAYEMDIDAYSYKLLEELSRRSCQNCS